MLVSEACYSFHMNLEKLSYWLALQKTPKLGVRTLLQLLRHIPSIENLFNQSNSFYKSFNLPSETIHYLMNPNWNVIEQDLCWLTQSKQHRIVTMECKDYPKILLEIASPPLLLYIKGNVNLLNKQQIAIVGSRKPSPEGREIAFELAKDLGFSNLVITSGLASGIDTQAHLGALHSSQTLAVIGTGIDITYPSANQHLAERIADQGAVISEFCLGTPPLPEHFPRRNRIISGLALAAVIVEANLQSGSLITAQFATEQGRDVFAVPGSIRNPRTKGCHELIKSGAGLVTSAQDILIELGLESLALPDKAGQQPGDPHFKLEDAHLKLLECIGYEPAKTDVLVERSGISVQQITTLLLDLELAGYVSSSFSGYRRVRE